jgi:hypothetical protein
MAATLPLRFADTPRCPHASPVVAASPPCGLLCGLILSQIRGPHTFHAFFAVLASLVPITIELPDLDSQTKFNLAPWTEILADPVLAKLPNRIETDRHGHILMTEKVEVIVQGAGFRTEVESVVSDPVNPPIFAFPKES